MRTAIGCLSVSASLVLGLDFSACALENEVWVSPIGPAATVETNSYSSGGIIGTPTYPLRCPDAGTFYWVMTQDLTNSYMTVHFMAGTFHLPAYSYDGFNASLVLKQGWKVRGAGIDNTTLQLVATNLGTTITYMLWGPNSNAVAATEVSDLTVDCNLQNQSSPTSISAIGLYGSDSRISRVKAINWGTVSSSECFVLWIQPANGYYATNCVIEDCIVTQPAAATSVGTGGITAICIFSDPPSNPSVLGGMLRNNLVYNIQVGSSSGMVGHITAFGASDSVNIIHNRAFNLTASDPADGYLAQGVYSDTVGTSNGIVEDNVLENVSGGIYFNAVGLTNYVIRNNIIRPVTGGTGIAFYEPDTNAPIQNLVLNDNIIVPAGGASNINALSFSVQAATATVMGNIFQGNGTGYDLNMYYAWTPSWNTLGCMVFWNTWVDNVNLTGTQFSNPMSQQCLPGDQDSIVFTPTTNGWYRVSQWPAAYAAATVRIESGMWQPENATLDTEFWFRDVGLYASTNTPGEIFESRRGSYYYPTTGLATQARIGSDCSGTVFLDIYFPAVSSASPVKVTCTGPNRPQMLTSPIAGPSTPCNSVTLTL